MIIRFSIKPCRPDSVSKEEAVYPAMKQAEHTALLHKDALIDLLNIQGFDPLSIMDLSRWQPEGSASTSNGRPIPYSLQ